MGQVSKPFKQKNSFWHAVLHVPPACHYVHIGMSLWLFSKARTACRNISTCRSELTEIISTCHSKIRHVVIFWIYQKRHVDIMNIRNISTCRYNIGMPFCDMPFTFRHAAFFFGRSTYRFDHSGLPVGQSMSKRSNDMPKPKTGISSRTTYHFTRSTGQNA